VRRWSDQKNDKKERSTVDGRLWKNKLARGRSRRIDHRLKGEMKAKESLESGGKWIFRKSRSAGKRPHTRKKVGISELLDREMEKRNSL